MQFEGTFINEATQRGWRGFSLVVTQLHEDKDTDSLCFLFNPNTCFNKVAKVLFLNYVMRFWKKIYPLPPLHNASMQNS